MSLQNDDPMVQATLLMKKKELSIKQKSADKDLNIIVLFIYK